MKAYSGEREGRYFFRYRPNMAGDAAVVEWGVDDAFALFPMAVSVTLIERGYAAPIGEELVQAYNDSLAKPAKRASKPAAAPAAPKQAAPVATPPAPPPAAPAPPPEAAGGAAPPPWAQGGDNQ